MASGWSDGVQSRPLAVGVSLLVLGAVGLVTTHAPAAGVTLLAGIALMTVAAPRAMLVVVIAGFAVHPLAMRAVAVHLGLTGLSVVLLAGWKEVALGTVLVVASVRMGQAWRAGSRDLVGPPQPFDLLAVGLIVLVAVTLAAQPSAAALNAGRLLLYPVGVYAAIRLGALRGWGDLGASLVIATGVALFGVVQGSFLGWAFVGTYWGLPDQPLPYTFTAQYLDGPRSSGTLTSPVELATYLAILISVTLAVALVRARRRWLSLIALPILVLALALTFSRSAIIAVALGGAVMIMVAWYRGWTTLRTLALVILVCLPAVGLSSLAYAQRGGIDLVRSTLITLSGEAGPPSGVGVGPPAGSAPPGEVQPPPAPPAEGSTVDHVTSLQEGMALVVDHPFGVGLGDVGSRTVPGSEQRPAYFAESWYLTMGLSLGWLGLLWAVAFAVALAALAIDQVRRGTDPVIGLSLIGVVAVVAVVGMVLPTMMEPQVAILPWVVAGLAVETTRDRSTTPPVSPVGADG